MGAVSFNFLYVMDNMHERQVGLKLYRASQNWLFEIPNHKHPVQQAGNFQIPNDITFWSLEFNRGEKRKELLNSPTIK